MEVFVGAFIAFVLCMDKQVFFPWLCCCFSLHCFLSKLSHLRFTVVMFFSRRVICSGVPHPSKPLVAAIAALIIPAPPRIVAALDTQSYIHMYIYICIYIYI